MAFDRLPEKQKCKKAERRFWPRDIFSGWGWMKANRNKQSATKFTGTVTHDSDATSFQT